MWEQNYPVAPAMTEMLVWLRDIERVKQHSGGYVDDSSSRYKSFGHITQHVYRYSLTSISFMLEFSFIYIHILFSLYLLSRSDTTEHLMFDCWTGLSAWLLEKKKDDKTKVFSADALLDLKPDAELDHTDTFKETLRRLNKFSRVSSGTRLQSVKDVFRSLFQTGKDIVDWWTRVVRDLDLVGEMDELSSDAYQPGSFLWTETMNGVVEQSLKVGESRGDSLDEKAAAAFAEANGAQWGDSYKSAMTDMEALRGLLPWATDDQVLDVEVKHSAAIRLLSRSKSLSDDAPLLHLQEPGGAEEAYESFLFVCPRYFRGIGITEELVSSYTSSIVDHYLISLCSHTECVFGCLLRNQGNYFGSTLSAEFGKARD